jgi:hypothetical protein
MGYLWAGWYGYAWDGIYYEGINIIAIHYYSDSNNWDSGLKHSDLMMGVR